MRILVMNSKIIRGTLFLIALLLTACGGGATGDGEKTPGNPPPTVASISPASNATGVAVNAPITATFSESMNASTLTTASGNFTLSDGSNNVQGAVFYSGTTATFKPSSALAASTQYTATITTGVKDL